MTTLSLTKDKKRLLQELETCRKEVMATAKKTTPLARSSNGISWMGSKLGSAMNQKILGRQSKMGIKISHALYKRSLTMCKTQGSFVGEWLGQKLVPLEY